LKKVVPFVFLLFGGGLFSVGAMFLEGAGRGKFPELVADHVFRDENGVENLAVVDHEGVADEVGRDEGAARPGFDWLLDVRNGHFLDFHEKMRIDKGAFFETTGHKRLVFLVLAAFHDEFV
jgi:hypothetical protein